MSQCIDDSDLIGNSGHNVVAAIRFYFDFLSPYAYLAHQRLGGLVSRYERELVYCPVDLEQLKLGVGNTGPSTRDMPIKHRHLRLDLQRWAAHYEVALNPPAGYGSQRLTAGVFYAIDRGAASGYVRTAWQLVWGEGGAMNDDALLAAAAARMGWNPDEFIGFASGAAARDRLRQASVAALECGVFGVPTMIADGQMWWGNDRLHFLENHLKETAK